MATFNSLEDIEVWQKARELSNKIYSLTSENPFSDDYPLKNQIRRAANSISLNIAEGYGLNSEKEFIRHLTIARGSTKEVQSAIHLAYDQNYIDELERDKLHDEITKLSKRISSLIQYLRK